MAGEDWMEANRANWDERVPIHLNAALYDMTAHRAGTARLSQFEVAEIGSVEGLRIFHPQCHFGWDSFAMAQMGAKEVLGVDFSAPAIAAARQFAEELPMGDRVRFLEKDIYSAKPYVPKGAFDFAYVTWGTIGWLPDLDKWADLIAHALRPGGRLYFADGHPAMWVFDDETPLPDGKPGYFAPYFEKSALVLNDNSDYADETATLSNTRTVAWMHPIADILAALQGAGMRLEWFHEHDVIPWQAFRCLEKGDDGWYRWPDKAWLPLSLSLMAERV